MFPCESCGHPLNLHTPCNATVGAGKKAHLCGCPEFSPADTKDRVGTVKDPFLLWDGERYAVYYSGPTDNADPQAAIAAALKGASK